MSSKGVTFSPPDGRDEPNRLRRARLALPLVVPAVIGGIAVWRAWRPALPKPELTGTDAMLEERRVRLRRGKERTLRDWHQPLPDPVSKQLDQAVAYFSNSIRVPAALLAAQAASVLLGLTEPPPNASHDDAQIAVMPAAISFRFKLYSALWRAHLLLTAFTVCAQLTAVLVCSTALGQILDISRDELALEMTAVELMTRHVEFEYVTVRLFFFWGLITYVLALGARMGAALGAEPHNSTKGQRELLLCAGLLCMLGATLTWWINIYCEDMTMDTGVGHLVTRFFELAWMKLWESSCAMLTVVQAMASLLLALASLVKGGRSSTLPMGPSSSTMSQC
mmetsp:Transcript_13011/g.28722  ORF Transcript_13011/g.28722 Transcript_13011/m.28722 type:complete len:337 (-) Transcript_13011:82-1092(-)